MNTKEELQKRARELNIALPKLLRHYAMERFLYRLSLSPLSDRFYLKGGMLLMGMGAGVARTTMDIDLLGRVSNSPDNIRSVVTAILRTKPGVSDGVRFSTNLRVEEIAKDALYVGVRVSFEADVFGACMEMKVDIGFSDEIYPMPVVLNYPSVLEGLPMARVQCYSPESIVAEKWQAMVQLKKMSSRMKDFYDLWFLSRHCKFDYDVLRTAVHRTFVRRSTQIEDYAVLKTEDYYKAQQPEWSAYIRKLKASCYQKRDSVEIPSRFFGDVMREILFWLEPIMTSASYRRWIPGKGWV